MGVDRTLRGLSAVMASRCGLPAAKDDCRLGERVIDLAPGLTVPGSIDVRLLGEIYETYNSVAGEGRRQLGSYYTPRPVVNVIVERTVAVLLGNRLSRTGKGLDPVTSVMDCVLGMRVCDPAMGAGYFLVRTLEVMSGLAESRIRRLGTDPDRTLCTRIRGAIASRCLVGMDLDPGAVDLARRSLWLAAADPLLDPRSLDGRFLCGDALSCQASMIPGYGAGYEVVVGNPPYGAVMQDRTRDEMAGRFVTASGTYRNTALHFLERCVDLASEGARVGLILPKSLVYSRGWWPGVSLVLPCLTWIIDASLAFEGVRLEQVVVLLRKGRVSRGSYSTGRLVEGRVRRTGSVSRCASERARCLLLDASSTEMDLFNSVLTRSTTIGAVAVSFRGLGLQGMETPRGAVRAVDGRSIGRWHIHRRLRRYDRDVLDLPGAGRLMVAPKLVTQNIVAHVTRPRPRIVLASAMDTRHMVSLDTVTNTVITDPAVDPWLVLAVLNSRFISWWAHRFVFAGAVRTMHMDASYMGRLPLPRCDADRKLVARAIRLARSLSGASGHADAARKEVDLEKVVCRLYGVEPLGDGYVDVGSRA